MRLTRTRIGSVLIGALIVLSACAPATTTTQSTGGTAPGTAPKPAAEQKLVIGQATITPVMHPYISICCTQRRYDIFDMIVGQQASGAVEPMAATAWKLEPGSDTAWRFTIRTDMKFHDGTPMTADDVVFSVMRAINLDLKYAVTNRLLTIKDAVKVDNSTVMINTKGPDPILLKRLALISILPKGYLEKVGDNEFSQKPIGTGPFKLKEFQPDNQIIVEAVAEHPFRKSKYLTQVTIRAITEPSARVAGLKTGELHMLDTVPIDQADGLKTAGFTIISIDAGSSTGFWMDTVMRDQPKTGPMANKLVRQALNYAIDRDSIVKNIYKGYTKPDQGQPIQPETFGFDPNLKPYPYDPAKAKALLAQAGYPNGFKIVAEGLFTPGTEGNNAVLFIQDQMKAIGVDMQISPLAEYAIFRDKFYGDKERADLFAPGLINTPAMDADFSLVWFSSKQAPGPRHYNNPEFDKWYDMSTVEMNDEKRKEYISKALQVMYEDPPWLYGVQGTTIQAFSSKIKDVERRTDREQRYDKIYIAG